MRQFLNTLFVLSEDAYLTLDGENVVVSRGKAEVGRVPLHTLESILCFSYAGASPALLGKCGRMGIDLSFYSPRGRFLARTVGEERGNVLLRQSQYAVAASEALSCSYARSFILGKVYNARWVLERATRDHPQRVPVDELKQTSAQLAAALPLVESCEDLEQLRGLEGEAAQRYFDRFNALILQQNDAFVFTSRSRRPPLDNVNALLSFAYSLLASECAAALEGAGLDPYVLLTSATPSPLVYHSANPLSSPDEATVSALQAAVSFQTQSDALYEIPGGLRLRVGRETLEIGNDGTVSYHTSEDAASRYPIGTTDGYTVSELVETTRRLAADTVGASCGAAQLYLMDITEGADGTTEVCYGYSLSGAAVLLPEDGCAARFTVRNGQIIDYTLRFRRYEETAEHSLLLPERQAAAAREALSPEGRELVVFYTDNGGDTVEAGWAAR